MKKILIALDYDPSAEKIAEAGYALASSLGAGVILLHVISDPSSYSALNYSPVMGFDNFNNNLGLLETGNMEELLNTTAREYLHKSKQHLGDESIETVVKDGDFGKSILDTATEMNVDIIVMGTHSRSGLGKILMGSVAENVLHHSSIPMYIIPVKEDADKK